MADIANVKILPSETLKGLAQELEAKLAVIREEQNRRASFTDEMRLTDRIHALLHYGVDCDYHYSDWNTNGPLSQCRAAFFHEVRDIIRGWEPGVLQHLISQLENLRRK